MRKKFVLFTLLIVSIQSLYSQENEDNVLLDGWKFNGYFQIIPYLDGKDFDHESFMIGYTSMKTRLVVQKDVGEHVTFKVGLQDSRILGEGNAYVSKMPPLFINEGYVQFNNIMNIPLFVKAGRFAMEYGDGRFISHSKWNYTERAFDGFMVGYHGANSKIDLFGAKEFSDVRTHVFGASPSLYASLPDTYEDRDLLGAYFQQKLSSNHEMHLFSYMESDGKEIYLGSRSEGYANILERYTVGTYINSKFNKLKFTLDFAYQFGNQVGIINTGSEIFYSKLDISAYLLALKLDYSFDPIVLTLGADMHSGTSLNDTSTNSTFDNIMAAKHKFMGYMDYFVGARALRGPGVNDFYISAKYKEKESDWIFTLFVHYFMANKAIQSNLIPDTEYAVYGAEIDFVVRYDVSKGIFVEWGNGLFVPDDAMLYLYGSPDVGAMSYLRATVNL